MPFTSFRKFEWPLLLLALFLTFVSWSGYRAMETFPERLKRVKEMVVENSNTIERLDRVELTAKELFTELAQTITLVEQERKGEAFTLVNTDLGERCANQIITDLDVCTDEEDEKLLLHRRQQVWAFRFCVTVVALNSVAVTVAFLYAFRFRLFRHWHHQSPTP